jgi:hypothetical protein
MWRNAHHYRTPIRLILSPLLLWSAIWAWEALNLGTNLILPVLLGGILILLELYLQTPRLRYIGVHWVLLMSVSLWFYPWIYFYWLTAWCQCAPWHAIGVSIPPNLLLLQLWMRLWL